MNRGDVAVCIVGATDDNLRAHIPGSVPILEVESPGDAFTKAEPADVVLLKPGVLTAEGWLDALRQAAYANSTTATATALTQHDAAGTADTFEQAAGRIREASLRIYPRIEAPGDACVYVRRNAIELVGGDGDDFGTRCFELGLAHVVADDVLVLDPGAPPTRAPDPDPPVARARAVARRALHGLTVTVDAGILYGPTTGSHVHVLELIAALARTERVRLRAIVPDQLSVEAQARMQAVPQVELLTYRDAPRADPADVVHRPFQLSNAGDLSFLQTLGERLVLTQQDLIAFHDPAYFASRDAWGEYRGLTRLALGTADRVLFFSTHARDDALGEELVDPAWTSVVHLGVDHAQPTATPAPPAGAERLMAGPVLLCLGTDYLHKNRVFALRLLRALRTRGVAAMLVFAGPTVAHGSSRPDEQRLLESQPDLSRAVLDLGAVSESEKTWLFKRSDLVLYPSVVEGFGLVPFEAAAHRVPCLWAPGTALSELLPDEAAGIVPWNAELSAVRARELLHDEQARARNLNAVDTAAQSLSWAATAQQLVEVYRATADAPARPRIGTGPTLTEDAARLVGPGGELPADVHRPLLALATHPRIAKPTYAALKFGYRLFQRRR